MSVSPQLASSINVAGFVSLVLTCVFWQLAQPLYWTVSASTAIILNIFCTLFAEGEHWDKLKPADDTINVFRNWRMGISLLTAVGVALSCALGVADRDAWAANEDTPIFVTTMIVTAITYIGTCIPSTLALLHHADKYEESRPARSTLATLTFFEAVYSVFTLVLVLYSTRLNDSDDILWRTIASYLVWVAILKLIYTEARQFSALRSASYLALYIVFLARLHDSADSLKAMRFTTDTEVVVLIVAGVLLTISLITE